MPHLKTITDTPAKTTDTVDLRPDTAVCPDHRKELLERILNHPLLPSPPILALQIIERTRQPDCKLDEIGNMLAQDPSLCGRLLKTLNSSIYGLSRPVTSLGRAVTMLGLKPLRSLVLGLTMSTMHLRQEVDDGLRRHWRNSVAGAIITREFAQLLKYPAADEDMVASLLRDLGMLLLRQSFPGLYEPVWNRSEGHDISHGEQCNWEQARLGIHHAEVGAALLEGWRLPDDIVEPIRYHHYPALLPPSTTTISGRTLLLDFTSRIARMDEITLSDEEIQNILHTAEHCYGLDRAGLEQFLADVTPKVEEFAAVLNVDIGNCPDFGAILAAGCDELIVASMQGATSMPVESKTDSAWLRDQMATHAEKPKRDRLIPVRCGITENDSCQEMFGKLTGASDGGRIQQYQVIEMIGQGAMGMVIKARDIALDRLVALKFLVPSLVGSSMAHERFALEARFAAAIRHEYVVTIFAVNEFAGLPFLVMEYIAGKSLQEYIDAKTDFTPIDIARIGRQVALGLAAAHELRLIHRDIKPANLILADPDRRVRITDFGLARAMDGECSTSQQGLLVGTPIFMSPEQVDGNPLTAASDLFSLGTVLYTMCTGRFPFLADSFSGLLNAVALKAPLPIRYLKPDMPAWLTELIEKLHVKDPALRFRPASAVAAYLGEHLR